MWREASSSPFGDFGLELWLPCCAHMKCQVVRTVKKEGKGCSTSLTIPELQLMHASLHRLSNCCAVKHEAFERCDSIPCKCAGGANWSGLCSVRQRQRCRTS